ncbi:MAG: TetR family transcriptional regulator [Polyangiaceae bacterium]|nr:TetR family transcriptional regulator [Polyangiaceae bacterium]
MARSSAPPPAATSPAGRRALRKAETRRTIDRAALALFRERGFDATTVDEIASAAGIGRRTFFRYFASKEDLMFPYQAERERELRRIFAAAGAEEAPIAAVRRAALALARVYSEERADILSRQRIIDACPALVARETELDRNLELLIGEHFARSASSGRTAARRARLLAGAVFGVIRAAVREWTRADGQLDLVALGNEAFDLLETTAPDLSQPRRRG